MQAQTSEKVNKGTTTIGLVCDEGVVMATEMRATMGNLISHKRTKKLFKIDNQLGLTVAGLVGDAQSLARMLRAEAELYKTKRGINMSVQAGATLLSNIMNARRMMPYMVQLLIGGVDRDGGHVYSLDAAGGAIPDDFVTTGSGSPFVYGVLEDHYEEGITVNEGTDLAIRALHSAMSRDSASGDGIALTQITESDGYNAIEPEEIGDRLEAMGKEF